MNQIKFLLIGVNFLVLLVGMFLGVVLFRYTLPYKIVTSERIEKCEALGGEYSIYSGFSGQYMENCRNKKNTIDF